MFSNLIAQRSLTVCVAASMVATLTFARSVEAGDSANSPGPAVTIALDGVWRSKGYGLIVEIAGGQATLYDSNKAYCRRQPETVQVDDKLFRNPRLSADGQLLVTQAAWGLTTIYYERITQLPPACGAAVPDAKDALYNFDVFWNDFDDYYAFFKQRAVDWGQVRDEYRSRITAQTNDAQLLEIFEAAFRQLQDRHVTLTGEKFHVNAGSPAIIDAWYAQYMKNPTARPMAAARVRINEYLQPSWRRYLDAGSIRRVSDNVTTATAAGGRIGYLSIIAEFGYSGSDQVADDIAAGTKELDAVFGDQAQRRGLILDLRINFGGHDDVALALAGLLTSKDRPGFSKCTRDGAGYTPIQRTTIRARPHAYTGPVVVLSSPLNMSASENFTMMVKDFSNVIIVGDRSSGVHSDAIPKQLPNGWTITQSSEAIIAPDGTLYEAIGVPPDVLVPYEPEEVKATGVDPGLEKALHLLTSPRFDELARGVKRRAGGGRQFSCT